MTNTLFYALIFICEVSTCFFYFEYVLQPKYKLLVRIPVYLAMGLSLFGCSFLSLPAVNLIAFMVFLLAVAWFFYNVRFRTCLFQAALLTALMLITEFISVFVFTYILKARADIHANDFYVVILQGALSKLLFIVAVFLAARFAFRHERRTDAIRSLTLTFFPLSSILLLWLFYDIAVSYDLRSPYTQWFMAGSVLLLFSNLIIYAVYESTQKINFRYTQLQLELQKEKISSEYYELLQEEHENTRILAHDIKGHLRILEDMAAEGRSEEISRYIEALGDNFHLYERIAYSGNRYVDVIINRYAQMCHEQAICMEVDVRRASLDFMSGSEITALLDNLLSNAVEAAAASREKRIELMICEQNINFVVIRLCNSCDIAPITNNGRLLSQKKSEGFHGLGVQSIRRIVTRYNGVVAWEYKPDVAEFEYSVVLKQAASKQR